MFNVGNKARTRQTGTCCLGVYRLVGDRTGEGNGTPLRYSCLENPRDGGAWWAAFYGIHRVAHD